MSRNWLSKTMLLGAAITHGSAFVGRTFTRSSTTLKSSEKDTELRTLHPAISSYYNGTIEVDHIHTLAYQVYGTPDAPLNALFLHGGPGAGCFPNHARFFDPQKFRIVLLDQRGCGKSTPLGDVRENTLGHLVQDCEALRKELGIDQWHVVLGGSWGTTVAIAYAQAYPNSIGSLVLCGVCLLRPVEVDWMFTKSGAASLDPDGWTNFTSAVGVDPYEEGRAALHAHYNRLFSDDPIARIRAARSWMFWEMRVSSLSRRTPSSDKDPSVLVWSPQTRKWTFENCKGEYLHDTIGWHEANRLKRGISLRIDSVRTRRIPTARSISPIPPQDDYSEEDLEKASNFTPSQAMLTCFYSVNERYATNNVDLLENIDKIQSIPCIAVQGAKDTVCPPDTALDLVTVWPEMELRMPTQSGHSMYDPAITNELVRATDRLAAWFLQDDASS